MNSSQASSSNLHGDAGRGDSQETGQPSKLPVETPPVGSVSVLDKLNQQRQKRQRKTSRRAPFLFVFVRGMSARIRRFAFETLPLFLRSHRPQLITGTISLLIHSVVLLLLAVWMLPEETRDGLMSLLGVQTEEIAEAPLEVQEIVQPQVLTVEDSDVSIRSMISELNQSVVSEQSDDINEVTMDVSAEAFEGLDEVSVVNGLFGGRSVSGRQLALKKFGGTAESERAVNLGLQWLQKIQRQDGSWCFAEIGDASDPGYMDTTDMGATSLALICFLGAGHTHENAGPFQDTVSRGLKYLIQNARTDSYGADLRGRFQGESGFYVQGLATICLCEAAAMVPNDKRLRRLGTQAVQFIQRTQHRAGGWRYELGQPGDTSVVGWQLMALQSAKSGKIRVSPRTLQRVTGFLNFVQEDDGAQYGYTRPQRDRPAMTAVGLLCRMYLGAKRENPALARGVAWLASQGPSREDIYYNYYATQVIHHFGADYWKDWNSKLRPFLVETQIQNGPAAGSWDVTDPHGNAGGRIYQTALSILTLEVYYRHLPLYRELKNTPEALGEDDPADSDSESDPLELSDEAQDVDRTELQLR